MLVPFDDPAALAEAVNGLLDDPKRLGGAQPRCGRSSGGFEVGRQTAAVLREAVAPGPPRVAWHPPPATCRGRALRTSWHWSTTSGSSGTRRRDRAAVRRATARTTSRGSRSSHSLSRTTGTESYHRAGAQPGFLRHAWSAEERGMRNFMSYERRWLDDPTAGTTSAGPRGRWRGGGGGVGSRHPRAQPDPAGRDVACARRATVAAHDGLRRARARPRRPRDAGQRGGTGSRALAGRLGELQRAQRDAGGYWAEDALVYDNARIPQALTSAGARLGDDEMVREGMRSLEWYAGGSGSTIPTYGWSGIAAATAARSSRLGR